MLISKTVCQAGSIVYLVPTGLQLTLHYDARGNLTNVYQGFGSKADLGQDFMKSLIRLRLVPNTVKLTGGITDIWGVLKTATNEEMTRIEIESNEDVSDIVIKSQNASFNITNIALNDILTNPTKYECQPFKSVYFSFCRRRLLRTASQGNVSRNKSSVWRASFRVGKTC